MRRLAYILFAVLSIIILTLSYAQKDGKVIAYPDGSVNSVHMDVITGGKEALTNASGNLAAKMIHTLNK
ncbi:MAG: hypothetical protein ABH806_03775 [Candidatus Omnitrophota bacterium]